LVPRRWRARTRSGRPTSGPVDNRRSIAPLSTTLTHTLCGHAAVVAAAWPHNVCVRDRGERQSAGPGGPEARILPAVGDELVVVAELDDPAGDHHRDPLRVARGGQPARER